MAEIVPPILTLNNDCLLKIFAYFDILELIELESVCRRFADVIQAEYKRRRDFVYEEYVEAYGMDFMTVEVFQKISKRIGPNLQLLDLNGHSWDSSQNFVTMLQHSENLEYLRFLSAFDIFSDSRSVDLLEKRSPKLKTIDISGSGRNAPSVLNLNKNNNQFMREASNLEILRLHNVDLGHRGNCNLRFPKLKEVSFVNCEMDFRDMKSFFINCHNSLEDLELTYLGNNSNSEDRLDAVTANLMNLKRFSFVLPPFPSSTLANLKTIANLPQLTDLTVGGCQPIKELLEALAERDILERLYIGELFLSDEMLLPLKKFRNLKSLSIESINLNVKFLLYLPLEHKLEYLDLVLPYMNLKGICFLAQHGERLKTIGFTLNYVPNELTSKSFADEIQPFVRDRLHPLTLEFDNTYGRSIPEVNLPGLKICKANRSLWPTKPLRP